MNKCKKKIFFLNNIVFLIVEIFHNATVLALFLINLKAALTSFKNFQKFYRPQNNLRIFNWLKKQKKTFNSNDPF